MEVHVGFENLGQLLGDAVRQIGLVGGGVQGATNQAAGQALRGHQGGRLDAHAEAVGRLVEHQAFEGVVAVAVHPVRAQGLKLQLIGGLGGHGAPGAATAKQRLSRHHIFAQEGRSGRIGQAQALQQRFGGVRGAGQLAAVQRESVRIQLIDLATQLQGLHRLGDQAKGFGWGRRRQGGHGERAAAAAQQQRCNDGSNTFGMPVDKIGQSQAG